MPHTTNTWYTLTFGPRGGGGPSEQCRANGFYETMATTAVATTVAAVAVAAAGVSTRRRKIHGAVD